MSRDESNPSTSQAAPGKKNRPTRTRKEAEAARKRSLVPDDRKMARKADRAERAKAREDHHRGLMTGDDKLLPPRDKGPVKRYARDLVDSRRNVGEFVLLVLVIIVFAPILFALPGLRDIADPTVVQSVTQVALFALIILWVGDSILLYRHLRSNIIQAYGEDALRTERPLSYGLTRAWQIRRFRLPRPQVGYGDTVSPK